MRRELAHGDRVDCRISAPLYLPYISPILRQYLPCISRTEIASSAPRAAPKMNGTGAWLGVGVGVGVGVRGRAEDERHGRLQQLVTHPLRKDR